MKMARLFFQQVLSLPTLELIEGQCDYTNIVQKDVEPKLAEYGQAAVKAFGMKERFFHIEFFRRKRRLCSHRI